MGIVAIEEVNTGKNPSGSNWATAMATSATCLLNNASSIGTGEFRHETIDATTDFNKPAGCVIVSDGIGRIYLSVVHKTNAWVHCNPKVCDSIYALGDKLTKSHDHVGEMEFLRLDIPAGSAPHPPRSPSAS
jgi:hypothetical protein